jgi:hypothetical protein
VDDPDRHSTGEPYFSGITLILKGRGWTALDAFKKRQLAPRVGFSLLRLLFALHQDAARLTSYSR